MIPKNSGKAPSMQWYPADWRQDNGVQSLSYHDRGVWFEMLNIMHSSSERGVMSINGSPMDPEMIARLLGLDNQTFNQTLSKLLTLGVAKSRQEDGAIFSKRMVNDEKLSQVRREAGKLGGNPSLLNQNPNQTPTTPLNQKPTPSSSTSTPPPSSVSIPTSPPTPKINKSRGTVDELRAYALEIGVPESDGESMFDHWEANGWKNGSNPVKDWKAGIRKWKSQSWLPSQSVGKAKQPSLPFSRNTGTTNETGWKNREFCDDSDMPF